MDFLTFRTYQKKKHKHTHPSRKKIHPRTVHTPEESQMIYMGFYPSEIHQWFAHPKCFGDTHPNGLSKSHSKPYPQTRGSCACAFWTRSASTGDSTSWSICKYLPKNFVLSNFVASWFCVLRTVGSSCSYQQLLKSRPKRGTFFSENHRERFNVRPTQLAGALGRFLLFPTLGPPQKIQAGCRDTLGANNGGHPFFLLACLRGWAWQLCKGFDFVSKLSWRNGLVVVVI